MDPNNDVTQASTSPVNPEEGIVIHPETAQPKADVLEVQNVTNEAQDVGNLSGEFEPTPAMIKFRDTLIRTDALRNGLSAVLKKAGLDDSIYWTWRTRYGKPFEDWVFKQWTLRKHAMLMRAYEVGLTRMDRDYDYWKTMMEFLHRGDAISGSAVGNWDAVQRLTTQYTLERKKDSG